MRSSAERESSRAAARARVCERVWAFFLFEMHIHDSFSALIWCCVGIQASWRGRREALLFAALSIRPLVRLGGATRLPPSVPLVRLLPFTWGGHTPPHSRQVTNADRQGKAAAAPRRHVPRKQERERATQTLQCEKNGGPHGLIAHHRVLVHCSRGRNKKQKRNKADSLSKTREKAIKAFLRACEYPSRSGTQRRQNENEQTKRPNLTSHSEEGGGRDTVETQEVTYLRQRAREAEGSAHGQ